MHSDRDPHDVLVDVLVETVLEIALNELRAGVQPTQRGHETSATRRASARRKEPRE